MDKKMVVVGRRSALVTGLVVSILVIGGLLALSCSDAVPVPPSEIVDEEEEEAVEGHDVDADDEEPEGVDEEPEEAVEENDNDNGHQDSKGQDDWAADGVIGSGEYVNSLDQGTYKLYWTSTEDTIRVAMQAMAEGWVALGLQPGQRMKDADMILGMVVDGEAHVLDSYSSGDFGPHKADSDFGGTDDVAVFGGTESGGTTTVEFERALDTGDSYDIALERDVAIGIIWAYGSTDDEDQRHSTRGYGEIVP